MKYQIVDSSCGVPTDDTLYDTYDDAVNAVLRQLLNVMIVKDPCDEDNSVTILTYEQQHQSPLRHGFGRKYSNWNEAPSFDRPVTKEEWDSHVHIYQTERTFNTPFSDGAPNSHLVFFLHRLDGRVYIVNTEGYEYCRYIARTESPY